MPNDEKTIEEQLAALEAKLKEDIGGKVDALATENTELKERLARAEGRAEGAAPRTDPAVFTFGRVPDTFNEWDMEYRLAQADVQRLGQDPEANADYLRAAQVKLASIERAYHPWQEAQNTAVEEAKTSQAAFEATMREAKVESGTSEFAVAEAAFKGGAKLEDVTALISSAKETKIAAANDAAKEKNTEVTGKAVDVGEGVASGAPPKPGSEIKDRPPKELFKPVAATFANLFGKPSAK